MTERLIAKKNVYADVPEDGGTVRRLVAAEGQPVPAAFADLVDAADVINERDRTRVATEDVYADVDEGLGTTVRRKVAAEGQPVPAAFDEHVKDGQTTTVEHEPGAPRGQIATRAASEGDSGSSSGGSKRVGKARQRA